MHVIGSLTDIANPAGVVLGRDHLQAGEPIEKPTEDQPAQNAFHNGRLENEIDQAVATDQLPPPIGGGMEVDGHLHLLGKGPKPVELLVEQARRVVRIQGQHNTANACRLGSLQLLDGNIGEAIVQHQHPDPL